jgi:hypothetical protein
MESSDRDMREDRTAHSSTGGTGTAPATDTEVDNSPKPTLVKTETGELKLGTWNEPPPGCTKVTGADEIDDALNRLSGPDLRDLVKGFLAV